MVKRNYTFKKLNREGYLRKKGGKEILSTFPERNLWKFLFWQVGSSTTLAAWLPFSNHLKEFYLLPPPLPLPSPFSLPTPPSPLPFFSLSIFLNCLLEVKKVILISR
jgi:hypothetical protein